MTTPTITCCFCPRVASVMQDGYAVCAPDKHSHVTETAKATPQRLREHLVRLHRLTLARRLRDHELFDFHRAQHRREQEEVDPSVVDTEVADPTSRCCEHCHSHEPEADAPEASGSGPIYRPNVRPGDLVLILAKVTRTWYGGREVTVVPYRSPHIYPSGNPPTQPFEVSAWWSAE